MFFCCWFSGDRPPLQERLCSPWSSTREAEVVSGGFLLSNFSPIKFIFLNLESCSDLFSQEKIIRHT
jgi:hypothetical protein